jgi:hypothetical protein
MSGGVRFASWGRFSDPVQTGKSQTVPALGAKLWDYYAQKPEEGAAFTQAMDGITSGIAEEVARVLDTSTTKLAIDVRGASGTLVHSLMMANPQLHGIILDLPDVVPSATAAASALGLTEHSRVLAGNFFDYFPEADIYLLKYILHDWSDGESLQILEQCRKAMRPGGRVILIERLLGEISEPGLTPLSDLNMMVMLIRRERTLADYGALLEDASFRLSKSTPIRSPIAVMEAVAA